VARFERILEKSKNEAINEEEAWYIFKETEQKEKATELLQTARFVREKIMGNTFKWSGGIARVLRCNLKPLCQYCPYWRKKGDEPLSIEEILKGVDYIARHGFQEFHLSGGTTLKSDGSDVLEIVSAIRTAGYNDMEIDINCGAAMSFDTLKELKQLGVKLVRSVFETINPQVFNKVKPGDDLEEKKKFARLIGEAGLGLGTGIMAGLSPNETKYQDYVDFIFHIKHYEHLKSVYVSKFFPFNGIPMKDHPSCSDWEAARLIAVMRLVLRDKDIGWAAGWGRDNYPTPLMAGAGNRVGGIHINRTPHYHVYQNEEYLYEDNMEFHNHMESTSKKLKELGIEVTL